MDMGSSVRISYPKRLFIWLVVYSILLVGCLVAFQYQREKRFKTEELNQRLQDYNGEILRSINDGNMALSPHLSLSDVRVSIIDTCGHVLYDNILDEAPTSNHMNREEIALAKKHGSGYTIRRHSESTGEYYFYSATYDGNAYIVRSAVPYSVSLSTLLHADMGFIWIMGAITLIMCIFGYFATRRIGLHILRLNRFAEMAESGEQIYDTAPFPNDELGSISNHIVRLYAHLQQAIADRDREHMSAMYEQQEKERIKKQLTNNINHELKTPVASMQVCLEILLSHPEMSSEKRLEFLHRCQTNTDRLKHLLDDVSTLTRMEDGASSISMEKLDLTEVIKDAVDDHIQAAESKNITIQNLINRQLPVNGNYHLLYSVFSNLIDNSILYSGGTEITIDITGLNSKEVFISVSDNGSGVAPVHLPRLFERFYRVDKGRSRQAGGTGLGLSIVKNTILLHKGTISVDNKPSGGLIYHIMLPLQE